MPQNFNILVDDQDSQINYLCPSLNQQILSGSYSNKTWTTIQSESCKDGWFEYTFYGTGIRIETPTAHPSQSLSVKLDNNAFVPQSDGKFESPILPDGKHTITYAIGDVALTPVFDYLTVTAGPSSPLNGRTLIVDDTDSAITFKGNWAANPPKPISFGYSTSLYQDTAHWSSTIGDTIEFEFTGTSVSVCGLATNIIGARNITATYSIDGVSKTQSIRQGSLDSVPMTEFFHADVPAGRHTLLINLTDIALPRAFGIDFIAYNTSVDSVTSLPGYEQTPTTNAAPQNVGASSNGSQKWAIVGGVLGAVLFLAILLLVFLVWMYRHRKQKPAVALGSNNTSSEDLEATKQAA